MSDLIFFSFDGDSIGRRIGQAVLSDDYSSLENLSHKIEAGNEMINNWVKSVGGKQFSTGGDQGAYAIPESALHDLEAIRKDYEFIVGATATFGVGKTLSESGKALIAGKLSGKNQLRIYDESVEQVLQETKHKIESGSASEDEQKQGESYLDAALGENMNTKEHNHEECEYCKEYDSKKEHSESSDDCPHCKEYEEKLKSKENEDCSHCEEYDNKVEQGSPELQHNPTTQDSQDFQSQDLNNPDIPKPQIGGEPQNVVAPESNETINNQMLDDKKEENIESAQTERFDGADKTPEEILEAIVQEGSEPSQEDRKEINENIDSTELPIDENMEGNVSRPDGYDSDKPSDMGLSEDESPDIANVIKEDLSTNSDAIQKEKTIKMIADALDGFKKSKDVLEAAKDQAPELYASMISMLKAMIEMSKMLGLDEVGPSDADQLGQEDQEWDSEITGHHEKESGEEKTSPK